jgi:Lamin Tail Domain/PKD domain/FlgD Ig-like domain
MANHGMFSRARLLFALALASISLLALSTTAWSQSVVISQIYGGGGNTNSIYTNDFIELYNPTAATVDLSGWSVQYTFSTGSAWQVTPLYGSLLPGHYYLIQEAAGAGVSEPLPTPDVIGFIGIAATNGKIALRNSTDPLIGSCPISDVVDLVGYGSANCFEGSGAAPVLNNGTSTSRRYLGCADTDDNALDFDVPATPNPRNSASPPYVCGTPSDPSGVALATPRIVVPGHSTLLTVTVTPGILPTSSGLAVTVDLSPIGGSAAQPFFDDGTHDDLTAGDNVFSFTATVAASTPVGNKSLLATITDAESRSGTTVISLQALFPTDPAPQSLPYAEDFNSLPWASTIYPTGWQGWEISTAFGPSFAFDGPNLDLAMLGNRDASSNSISAYNYDEQIGFLTGNLRVLALALALNTTGQANILLEYDIGVMHNPYGDSNGNTCIGEATVQYRVGTTGLWTNVSGTLYQSLPALQIDATVVPQNPQSFAVVLPSDCENQPVVQLRWTSRDLSPPLISGRPSFVIDNVRVTAETCHEPVVTIVGPASGSVFPIGTPVTFTGSYTDDNGGVHTAQWMLDDTPVDGVVDNPPGTVTATHTFTTPGVYLVSLSVTNACGKTGTASTVEGLDAMVVIYDPSAGFVTGGGWLPSPAGAYVPDPSVEGHASFGFVSKYQRGASAPTGETEFQFQGGNMSFHSTTYQWLVIAGARAQYKGTGTINGSGDYGFLLTATDGDQKNVPGPDQLRMKAWSVATGQVVYDNQFGAPDTAEASNPIGGGSIVIHGNKDNSGHGTSSRPESRANTGLPFALHAARPDPFVGSMSIVFDLPKAATVRLDVFDLAGRHVAHLADGSFPAGARSVVWKGRSDNGVPAGPGVYLVRIVAVPDDGQPRTAVQRVVRVN